MNVVCRGESIRVPDFLIVGAARSGTTMVYSFLDRHPRIFMPREKEPMFLSVYGQGWSQIDVRTGRRATYVIESLDDYLNLFRPARNGQLIGEASTRYLYQYPVTIGNIREIYGEKAGDLKIIILLRNPADRAWSNYLLKRRNGEEGLPFEQAIREEVVRERLQKHYTPGFDYVGFGRYFRQVKSYLDNFPQVKILLFEDIMKNLTRAKWDICEFLGVEAWQIDKDEKKLNVSGSPKNKLAGVVANLVYRPGRWKSFLKFLVPFKMRAGVKYRLSERIFLPDRMNPELKNRLAAVYRDDILDLSRLIKKDLSGWLPRTAKGK
jgi:hypothetical protein